jgi:dTDP-4-dehydrorhamnose reductase
MVKPGSLLIVGGDSTLGRALVERLKSDHMHFLATTRRSKIGNRKHNYFDLSNDISDWHPPSTNISVAVICAAITSLQRSDLAPEETKLVNVTNTLELCERLTAKGAFVLYPSTNLVYDGSVPKRDARDHICPTTEYGRQKAEVEQQLLAYGELACVVRFTKILSQDLPLFRGWIESLQSGNVIHPFSDMVMAPVGIDFAIEVLMSVIHSRLSGIVQVSASEDISYAEVASHFAMKLGVSEDLIQPISSTSRNLPLNEVPLHTTLDASRLRSDIGFEPPDVWATVDSVFNL